MLKLIIMSLIALNNGKPFYGAGRCRMNRDNLPPNTLASFWGELAWQCPNILPSENGENIRRCIRIEWLCVRPDPCGDNTDEAMCTGGHGEDRTCHYLATGEGVGWRCKTGKQYCIYNRHVCNGKSECPGGEDESDCELPGSKTTSTTTTITTTTTATTTTTIFWRFGSKTTSTTTTITTTTTAKTTTTTTTKRATPSIAQGCTSKLCHPTALCSSNPTGFSCRCKEGDVGDPFEAGCLPASRFPDVISPTSRSICGYKPDSSATTHIQCGSSISALNAPWQVSIFQNNDGRHWCGGVLVSERHILTAAHCFASGECWRYDNNKCDKRDFRVFFGRTNATISQSNGRILDDANSAYRRIEDVFVHPKWQYANRESGGHDIAVITVRPVTITSFIKPACLPNPLTHFFLNKKNEKIELSGFGKNASDDATTPNIPHQLQLAQMKIIDKPICDSKLGGDVAPDIFCTIPANPNDDCIFKPGSCRGDSGGPGVVKDPLGQHVVVGLVSGGPPCGEKESVHPHQMTSVSHHLSFILDHMEESPCPPPLGAAAPPSCNKKFAELVSDIQCSTKGDCPEGARCLDNFCTSYKDDAQARLARTDCSSSQECLSGTFQCDPNVKKCRPDKTTDGSVIHVAGGRGVLSVPSLSSQGILSQTISNVRSSCWGYKSCAVRTTDDQIVCEIPYCTHSRCWCPYPVSLFLDLSTYKFVDRE